MEVRELEKLIEHCFELKADIDEEKAKLAELQYELERNQEIVKDYLNSIGKDNYHAQAGLFSVVNKVSYKMPKDMEEKQKFFDYLRARGVFEEMASVHSRTLNSWANQEMQGQEGIIDYEIPGLGTPEIYQTISMRRK